VPLQADGDRGAGADGRHVGRSSESSRAPSVHFATDGLSFAGVVSLPSSGFVPSTLLGGSGSVSASPAGSGALVTRKNYGAFTDRLKCTATFPRQRRTQVLRDNRPLIARL
jgi:hypothetical protein